MTKPKHQDRAVIYLRESAANCSISLAPQCEALKKWAKKNGIEIVAAIEEAKTGKAGGREELARLSELIERERINVVICPRFDHVASSLSHLTRFIKKLDEHECALVVTEPGIDTRETSPFGRKQKEAILGVAQFEHDIVSEVTKAGLAKARSNGVKLGRKRTPLPKGWEKIVEEWKAEGGKGFRTLAKRLGGKVSLSTLHGLVNGPSKPSESSKRGATA